MQATHGQVARHHTGLRAQSVGGPFDLDVMRKTGVGAAFDGRCGHGVPPDVRVDVALS
jgi:hypothetical protein